VACRVEAADRPYASLVEEWAMLPGVET
jgi:hypothetical protein